jgi:hypothetical protein
VAQLVVHRKFSRLTSPIQRHLAAGASQPSLMVPVCCLGEFQKTVIQRRNGKSPGTPHWKYQFPEAMA